MFVDVPTFVHTQNSSSNIWVIVHNLGVKAPIVDCWLDIGGEIVKVIPKQIEFVDINTCNVHFVGLQVGTAVIA